MRKQGVVGRTVQISVRFAVSELTRSATMPTLTDVTAEIYAAAVELYDRLGLDRARIRRVEVRMQQLVDVHPPTGSLGSPIPSAAGGRPTRPSMRQCRVSAPAAVQRLVLTSRRQRRRLDHVRCQLPDWVSDRLKPT